MKKTDIVSKTAREIKSLNIQGASRVALAAADAMRKVALQSKAPRANVLLSELLRARNTLISSRPTEPCMRNAVKFIFHEIDCSDSESLRRSVITNSDEALRHLRSSERLIAEIGSARIRKGMSVFTHCHSSNVLSVLKLARKKRVNFVVHNTETRPLMQGRKTAAELAAAGIRVIHYVDSGARIALKKCDIMLIGADAITSEGKVINKIGSELFCEAAKRLDVPVYVCADSWKFDYDTVFGFDEPVEMRSSDEIWKPHTGRIRIDNHAFEIISPELVVGVITELGIYRPDVLVEIVKERHPWITGRLGRKDKKNS